MRIMMSRVGLASLKHKLKDSITRSRLGLVQHTDVGRGRCRCRSTYTDTDSDTDSDPDAMARMELSKKLLGESPKKRFATHSLVKSLLQVFSISLHTHGLDKERPSNIYGCIQVAQGRGHGSFFTLYDRDPADPETILEQGNLSLISSSPAHISGSSPTSMDFFLKDMTRDVTIINAHHNLDSEIDSSYDKLKKDIIQGDHGSISVCYVTWQFAILVTVEVHILETYDTKNPSANVYGTVLAGYANIKRKLKNDDGLENMRTILFSKSSDQAVWATVAEPLCLSSSFVAMPLYASLHIQVELLDSYGQFASGSVEFIADYWRYRDTKTIKGDGGVVAVNVKCHDIFSDIHENEELGNRMHSFAGSKETSESKRILGLPRKFSMPSGEQLPSAVTALRSTHSSAKKDFYEYSGELLTEIFSIIVSGFSHDVSALCGKIGFNDGYPRTIYERDFSNPELLSGDRSIITLEGPCDVDNCDFDVTLDLKDPASDLEICYGLIPWGPPTCGSSPYWNTRLCSMIQGANGYAAVYYTIFSSAFRALLEMTIITKDGETVSGYIYGCVLARYSTHDYSNTHDKRYYQSILFNKPRVESMELSTQSNIPLSKISVAVPSDSSLVIEANLWLECIDNQNHGVVNGTVEFEVDLSDNILKEIQGDRYRLLVSVKFHNQPLKWGF